MFKGAFKPQKSRIGVLGPMDLGAMLKSVPDVQRESIHSAEASTGRDRGREGRRKSGVGAWLAWLFGPFLALLAAVAWIIRSRAPV